MQLYKIEKYIEKGLTRGKMFDIIIKLTERNGTEKRTVKTSESTEKQGSRRIQTFVHKQLIKDLNNLN